MSAVGRLATIGGVFLAAVIGWGVGEWAGAAVGLVLGLLVAVVPWRGQPLCAWASHYLNRNRPIPLADPITVANDRSGGGVRCQNGVAIAVVHVLGKAYRPTLLTGSASARTDNTLDIAALLPMLRQSMDLTIESVSVVTAGARRRNTGDYPRVYDTLLGATPYAGQRETWLVIRIAALDNAAALRGRKTLGVAALAAAQRIAAALRCDGVRAKVGTATDIVELDGRLGYSSLEPHNRRWHTIRGQGGWLTTYAYRPQDLDPGVLAQAWTLQADGLVQNVTVFPDGTACAAVTIRTAQPPTAVPSVVLKSLPGEQAPALANALCGPRTELSGQERGPLPAALPIPVGPSGILLGKLAGADRLLLPLGDPGEISRVRVVADDVIAKRIIIRAAAAGERITLHSKDVERWDSVRMPNITVTDRPRPAPGTTLSVTDGTVTPAPRPATVLDVVSESESESEAPGRGGADVVIVQTGPATVEVRTPTGADDVEVELFRAENRYLSAWPAVEMSTQLQMAE